MTARRSPVGLMVTCIALALVGCGGEPDTPAPAGRDPFSGPVDPDADLLPLSIGMALEARLERSRSRVALHELTCDPVVGGATTCEVRATVRPGSVEDPFVTRPFGVVVRGTTWTATAAGRPEEVLRGDAAEQRRP